MNTFKEAFQQFLDPGGLSPADVAELTGLGLDVVEAFRTGRLEPTLDETRVLANGLRCSIDELLGHELEPQAEFTLIRVAEELSKSIPALRSDKRIDESHLRVLWAIASTSGGWWDPGAELSYRALVGKTDLHWTTIRYRLVQLEGWGYLKIQAEEEKRYRLLRNGHDGDSPERRGPLA